MGPSKWMNATILILERTVSSLCVNYSRTNVYLSKHCDLLHRFMWSSWSPRLQIYCLVFKHTGRQCFDRVCMPAHVLVCALVVNVYGKTKHNQIKPEGHIQLRSDLCVVQKFDKWPNTSPTYMAYVNICFRKTWEVCCVCHCIWDRYTLLS